MKILLIHNYHRHYGGEETYFESVCDLLQNNGHQVIRYTKDSSSIKSISDKITTVIGLFFNFQVHRELSDLIEKEKPDIALVQNIYPLITANIFRTLKRYKIPIIQRVSNYRFLCPKGTLFRNGKICELCINKKFKYPSFIYGCYQNSRLASFIFSLAYYFHTLIGSYKKIDKYIFPTNFIRNYYLKYAAIKKEKSIVIPTFTDIRESEINKNTKKKDKYFLYFGRLSEEKGIIQLLEVFKTLPSIKLIIIGSGPLMNKIKEFSNYKNIIIKGFLARKNISEYIKNALAVIIPSLWYDVMPNVLIESISLGTPVIVPKFGVFPELVKKNQGFFYEQNDFQGLRSVILKIKNSKKPNSIIDDIYTPKQHIDKLTKLFKNLLSKN